MAISSYAALSAEPGRSVYSMTKSALNTAVQVMSKEFLKRSIRVNGVMPALVMNKMASDDNTWTEKELEERKLIQPLGVIPIEHVVNCVEFLMSEDLAFITGELIAISGGYKFCV